MKKVKHNPNQKQMKVTTTPALSRNSSRRNDHPRKIESSGMLHPCPTQSIHMGILAASPSLLSTQLNIPARPEPRQRGKIRVSWPDPI
jgi:hypothetical protein